MQNKNKLKFDFVAEIPIEQQNVAQAFKTKLSDLFEAKVTEQSKDRTCIKFSSRNYSFLSSFWRGIPSEIRCCIQNTKKSRSAISMSFGLPLWLRMYLYIIMLIISLFMHVPAWLMNKYIFTPFYSHGQVGIFEIAVFASFFVGSALFFVFAFSFIGMLGKYKIWAENILSHVSKTTTGKEVYARHSWYKAQSRLVLGRHLCIFIILFPLSILIHFHEFPNLSSVPLQNYYIIIMMLSICLWIYNLAGRSESGQYGARRTLVLCNNIILALCLAALLAIPVANFHISGLKGFIETYPVVCQFQDFSKTLNIPLEDNPYANAISEFMADVRGFSFLSSVFQISVVVIAMFFVYSLKPGLQTAIGSLKDVHRKGVKQVLPVSFMSGKLRRKRDIYNAYELPRLTKLFLVAIFIMVSVFCWLGVFFALSILSSLISHESDILRTEVADITVKSSLLSAHVWTGLGQMNWLTYCIRGILLAPAILPFLLFLCVCFFACWKSFRKHHSLVLLEGMLAQKAQEIANEMGVGKIKCVIDTNLTDISPKAEIRGFVPKKIIIFTKNSLVFFKNNPNHVRPIIAHELAHLKLHCRKIRCLRVISRTSLLGKGFLSVFLNSIKIEDQADRLAVIHLKKKGDDAKLLGNAIAKMDKEEGRKKNSGNKRKISITSLTQGKGSDQLQNVDKNSVLTDIWDSLRLAYLLYFETDAYDYIHPPIDPRLNNLSSK